MAIIKKCTQGPRHAWNFLRNVIVRTQTLRSASITKKGLYRCACGEKKYGPPAREPVETQPSIT